jgi:hypothetical protein
VNFLNLFNDDGDHTESPAQAGGAPVQQSGAASGPANLPAAIACELSRQCSISGSARSQCGSVKRHEGSPARWPA